MARSSMGWTDWRGRYSPSSPPWAEAGLNLKGQTGEKTFTASGEPVWNAATFGDVTFGAWTFEDWTYGEWTFGDYQFGDFAFEDVTGGLIRPRSCRPAAPGPSWLGPVASIRRWRDAVRATMAP